MEKYNVLFITPYLNIGGEELSTIALADGLMKRGHKIYYMSSKGPLVEELINKKIHFSEGRMNARNIFELKKGVIDIRKMLMEYKIDIIHCSDPHTTVMSYIANKFVKLNTKIIWHDRRTRFYPLTARMMNLFAEFVITNSNFEKKRLIDNGLSYKKVKTIHNALNIPLPENELLKSKKNDKLVIGIVGRLVPVKGHKYFIKAVTEVKKNNDGREFWIIGDGFLREKLQKFVIAKKMEQDVKFTGFRRNLVELYSSIDILVNTSLYESFGNTCLEAMAFGKPVVASDAGGIPEVVQDGVTGILVTPKDYKKIAEAIIYLLNNPYIATKMGEAGRKSVKEYFTMDRVGNELEEVYQYVMEN